MIMQSISFYRANTRLVFLAFTILFVVNVAAYAAVDSDYVGSNKCNACHQAQYQAWQSSDHERAMQEATNNTVLGDFNNASITQYGVTSTFYKKNDKFMVRTEGKDGKLHDYQIQYTFGVEPLQQYLIAFPGGRFQALSLAWDARPKEQGGQRWFHLYPNEKISHTDELHWTGISQNWNGMCADCHSTNLQKNYNAPIKTFNTQWSEINVACEACHGPGSNHVKWAQRAPGWEKYNPQKGLVLNLDERVGVSWKVSSKTGNATRSQKRVTHKEIDMCARCHARRSPITSQYDFRESFLDQYKPDLLRAGMYYADGQINDEVYVYGSFLQSKMYHAGVTCSDCHEPHTLKLRAAGNGVCLQCHQGNKYDQASHHNHKAGSSGASCPECHMPPKNYMVVDPRHDHSMRIPRPDISLKLGTPNACNNCHQNKNAQWAATQTNNWYGKRVIQPTFQNYAFTLQAARHDFANAGQMLAELIHNENAPAIARATALSEIGPYLSGDTIDVISMGAADQSPLLRAASLQALEHTPINIRIRFAFSMLDDPVRLVRIEAARVLASFPAGELPAKEQKLLSQATQEYLQSQLANADRHEAQTNLGNLYAASGDEAKALTAYQTAISLNPAYIPAYVNFADFYRSRNQEDKAAQLLREAIAKNPNSAVLHHALGLSLVRQKNQKKSLDELRLASTLDPANARYVYVYAVALNSSGNTQGALAVLQKAQQQHPNNRDIYSALLALQSDKGRESQTTQPAVK